LHGEKSEAKASRRLKPAPLELLSSFNLSQIPIERTKGKMPGFSG
jgi:hypothetical protein